LDPTESPSTATAAGVTSLQHVHQPKTYQLSQVSRYVVGVRVSHSFSDECKGRIRHAADVGVIKKCQV